MNKFKNTAIRLTALLLFLAMIAAVVLWKSGVYDISFIKRPVPDTEAEETTGNDGDDTAGTVTDTDTETEFYIETEPESETELSDEDMRNILSMITGFDEKGNLSISLGIFGENSSIAKLGYDFGGLAAVFSGRKADVSDKVVYRKSNGYYSTKTVTKNEEVPTVRLYYGLVVIDDGKKVNIYNKDGELLVKGFTGTFINALTVKGDPAVKIGSKFYGINSKTGLTSSMKESKINYLALNFDSPVYYGAEREGGPYPFSRKIEKYTLVKLTGEKITTPPETETASDTDTGEPDETGSADASEGTEKAPEETAAGSVTAGEKNALAEPGDSTDTNTRTEDSESVPPKSDETKPIVIPDGVVERDGEYYSVSTTVKWGYYDADGNVVVEPIYKKAYNFTDSGYAAVVDFNDRLIFIDTEGNPAVDLTPNEKIAPKENNNVAIHQVYFEPVTNTLSSIGSYYFDNGYVMVRYVWRGIKYTTRIIKSENRLVSTSGREFVLPSGYTLEGYSDGVLLVRKDQLYGYINFDGSWIKPTVYKTASPFIQGLASVQNQNGKYGLIDREGNYVLPMCFDYISNVSRGLVAAFSEERGWEIYCITVPKGSEDYGTPIFSRPEFKDVTTDKTTETAEETADTSEDSETSGSAVSDTAGTTASDTERTPAETSRG